MFNLFFSDPYNNLDKIFIIIPLAVIKSDEAEEKLPSEKLQVESVLVRQNGEKDGSK